MSVPTPEPEIRISPGAAVSILLMVLGTIGMTVGLTIAFGLPAVFVVPGTIFLTIGVALAFRT